MTILHQDLPTVYNTGEILEDKTDWRTLKLKSLSVSYSMIGYEKEFLKRSERILECGSVLRFTVYSDGVKKLTSAMFCRDRMCPACQKRRSLVMFHQVKNVCLSLQSEFKSTSYLLLTLTVPNVTIDNLKSEMQTMNSAWLKMTRRTEFKNAIWGWFKALEVTHNKRTDTYHPHFHILLAVPNKYFKGTNYINQARWLELWRESMKNDSITQVDVRRVKPNPKRPDSTAIESAAAEVGKYATKPSDYIEKVSNDEYKADSKVVRDLAINLKGKRLTAFGGRMKEHYIKLKLKDVEGDDVDMVNPSGDDTSNTVEAVMEQLYRFDIGFKDYIG